MGTAMEMFAKGGPVMWPLLLCSVLSVTVSVERALFWLGRARKRTVLTRTLPETETLVLRGDSNGALQILSASADPAAEVVSSALAAPDSSSFASVAEQAAVPVMRRCRRGLRLLDTVVTIAPMLGLLGTVTGVIRSFGFLGSAALGSGLNPSVVGGGIAEALITTAFGLTIAIVTVVPYNYFGSRVQREAEDISAIATRFEEAIKHEDPVGI